MIEMRGHVLPDHPLARYFKGHVPFERTALFRAFRAAVGTHVKVPAWAASGDFRACFLLVIPVTDGIYRFASGSDAMARFGINVVGGVGKVVTAQIDGVWESANNKSLPVGQLTLFEYERIDSVFAIRVNAVEKHVSVSSLAPVMLDQLFVDNNGTSNHFDGHALLADLQDLDTPSNSRRYSNFSRSDGIVPNELSTLGAELCDFANLASQGVGWTFDGAIKKHADDSSTFDLGVDVDAGTRYRLQYKKRSHTAGDPAWKVGGISQSGVMPQIRLSDGSEGGSGFLFVPTVSGRLGIGATIGRLEIEALSVREDATAGQLHNGADGSIQRYTKKGQDWQGRDLLSGLPPNLVYSPWIDGDDGFEIDGSQSAYTALFWAALLSVNGSYTCVILVSGASAGGVRPENGDIDLAFTTGNGRFEYDFTTASNSNFNIQADKDFDGAVRFSLHTRIPIATGAES